jgi:hypothetical protein
MPETNITRLVSSYIMARDLKAKLKADFEAKVEPLTLAMDKTEAAILQFFDTHNMDSAKCEAGTAYKTMKSSATVADMDAFLGFVRANEAWHFLEKRVAKTQVDEYVAAHQNLPPGVNYSRIAAVNIRRS